MSPSDLDRQSTINLDGWIELGSEKWRELDPDPQLTKKFLKVCLEADAVFFDQDGRIWSKANNGEHYYPFHFEVGRKKYGFRMSTKAAN